MVECYYVILIIVLMYLIYINCKSEEEGFASTRISTGKGITKNELYKDCPDYAPHKGWLGCYKHFFGPRYKLPPTLMDVPYYKSYGNNVSDPGEGNRKWVKCFNKFYPECPANYVKKRNRCGVCEYMPGAK